MEPILSQLDSTPSYNISVRLINTIFSSTRKFVFFAPIMRLSYEWSMSSSKASSPKSAIQRLLCQIPVSSSSLKVIQQLLTSSFSFSRSYTRLFGTHLPDRLSNIYLRSQTVILLFVMSSGPPLCLSDLTQHKNAQTDFGLSQ